MTFIRMLTLIAYCNLLFKTSICQVSLCQFEKGMEYVRTSYSKLSPRGSQSAIEPAIESISESCFLRIVVAILLWLEKCEQIDLRQSHLYNIH